MYMKAEAILSVISGFLYGLIGYFVLLLLKIDNAFGLAVVCGLLFGLLLFPVLLVYGRITNKRYEKFEKEITSPIFCKANGNFNLGNSKVKNGNIYFCEAGIVCVCLEEKPYTMDQILLQDISHYEADNIHLNIYSKDGRVFAITLPDVPKIMAVLQEKHWI